jgi:hypothetical protein
MILGQGEEKGLLTPWGKGQAFDGLQGLGADKPAVESSRLECRQLGRWIQVAQFHQTGRAIFPEPLDQSDEFDIRDSANKGEAQAACFSLAIGTDCPGGVVNVTKNGPRFLQETSARIGQSDRVGTAGEDFGPELCLQSLDLAGERRLGEMKLPGGLGKAEVIRDGNEAFEFPHIDPIHAKYVI